MGQSFSVGGVGESASEPNTEAAKVKATTVLPPIPKIPKKPLPSLADLESELGAPDQTQSVYDLIAATCLEEECALAANLRVRSDWRWQWNWEDENTGALKYRVAYLSYLNDIVRVVAVFGN